jgi:hypothetical protein
MQRRGLTQRRLCIAREHSAISHQHSAEANGTWQLAVTEED